MEHYKVAQPHTTPDSNRLSEIMRQLIEHGVGLSDMHIPASSPYIGWEKFKQKYARGLIGKLPVELKPEEAWSVLMLLRQVGSTESPILDTRGRPFWWGKYPEQERLLHDFDMRLGGNMASPVAGFSKKSQNRFLRQGLIEEAIASSQLEGAATTRERAKKMFVENRRPASKDEWMIFNNYQTIKKIEEETANYPLSEDVLLNLHLTMTEHTFGEGEEDKQGRFRKDSDEVVVTLVRSSQEYIVHTPPDEKQLSAQLKRLIAFANDEPLPGQPAFLHPIIKAIMLHFWFAYLHPFCDGNGRLSRSLFYWYLMRHGYWLMGYIPISTVIKKSPGQYADAFLFSEQYNNDLTYFIDYNLRKLQQAQEMFDRHLEHVKEKTLEIDKVLPDADLNNRQKQAIHHLLGKPDSRITTTQHATFHEVGWLTAQKDLKGLYEKGYLDTARQGRELYYSASPKLLDYVQ